jgi:DNA-directed RNA polymerase specialized sigma24 family protein
MENQSTGLAGDFPKTHWTTIFCASDWEQAAGRDALGRLIERYRAPLLAHTIWKFHADAGQAEDWLQGFFLEKILEKDLLKCARADRGSFRGFLCKSLDNFVRDQIRRENRDCRKPAGALVPLDEAPEPVTPQPTRAADPFDVDWAKNVFSQAVAQMREFYEKKGREDLWNIFDDSLLQPALKKKVSPSMAELAVRFGFVSDKQASNALGSAKRQFRQCLRGVISEYADGDPAIDAEIRELIAVLSDAGL